MCHSTPTYILLHRTPHANILVTNVIWHVDFDVGEVPLDFLLYHGLHKDPAFALEAAVTTIDDAENAFAECLLHFADKIADLAEELGFDIVAKAAVCIGFCVAVQL